MRKESFDERIRARFADVERERSDMHDYQVEDVAFMKRTPFSFGLIGLGLGKSVTGGTVIADLLQNWTHEGKVLIIGPIPIVMTSWPDEFRTWRHLASLSWTVLREDDADPRIKQAAALDRADATAKAARAKAVEALRKERQAALAAAANPSQRKKVQARFSAMQEALEEKHSSHEVRERRKIRHQLAMSAPDIHLISVEGLEWLVEFHGRRWPYRTVIFDECSLVKSHTSGRFKALAKVRQTPGLITRMHLFTGTPASESYEALWAPTYLLDLGERFGKDITHFRETYFTQNRYTLKYKLRPGAEEEILAKLADISTIRRREDYFDTQEAMIVMRRVHMDAREQAMYDSMLKSSIVAVGDRIVEAETAAALTQKLSQMASGVLYDTDIEEPEGYDPDSDDDLVRVTRVHHIHDHKIEMLKVIVDELAGENLLVSYQHRSSLDRLTKAFPKAVKWDKTGKSKAPWNAGKIPMMLMHPRSGAHGNNLQKGGHYVVFFDIPWSREQFIQLIGRLDRQGQEHPVTVICLVAHGTIDETIAKAQADKKFNEEELFRILKRLIRKRQERHVG